MRRALLPAAYVWLFFLLLYTTARFPESSTDPVASLVDFVDMAGGPRDMLINLLMFMPPAAMLVAHARRVLPASGALTAAVGVCLAVSIFAEIVQMGIPGRHSSLLDVTLNGVGAMLGSEAVILMERRGEDSGN